MYVRYPLSLRQVDDILFERALISVMGPCGSDGTASGRFSPLRSANGIFIGGHIHFDAGMMLAVVAIAIPDQPLILAALVIGMLVEFPHLTTLKMILLRKRQARGAGAA